MSKPRIRRYGGGQYNLWVCEGEDVAALGKNIFVAYQNYILALETQRRIEKSRIENSEYLGEST